MINGSTDIQSLAYQFMQADRASQDQLFRSRTNDYQSRLKAYTAISDKISELQDTLKSLAQNKKFEAFSVTQSAEGYADITASGTAAAGQYQVNIAQRATAHQVALDFASETDPVATSGTLTLGVGADSFTVDMSTLPAGADLTKLRDAINGAADNPGVQASIVRTSGGVKLMINSTETGAANTLSLSTDGSAAMAGIQTAIDNKATLSQAQDAKIFLGEGQTLELTSSSNTFENVIDGLTINLTKTHSTATEVLTFTVGQDTAATTEQLQTLVDGYNAIVDTVSRQGSQSDSRVLSGDSTSRMLIQQLRREIAGFPLAQMGIETDRAGKLRLDATKLGEYLTANPAGLTEVLGGETGLVASLEARLETFVKGDSSMLKSARNSVQSSLDQLNDRMERFDRRMEQTYDRYVAQFSKMQTLISQMEQTSGLF